MHPLILCGEKWRGFLASLATVKAEAQILA